MSVAHYDYCAAEIDTNSHTFILPHIAPQPFCRKYDAMKAGKHMAPADSSFQIAARGRCAV